MAAAAGHAGAGRGCDRRDAGADPGQCDALVAGGFGAPVTQTCSGPLCAVGVGSGMVGAFAGILVILIGLAMSVPVACPAP